MKINLTCFVFALSVAVLMGCSPYQKTMYTSANKSGNLTLSHYTSLIPTLGPCGFARNYDSYTIKTPRISGRATSDELYIFDISHPKCTYSGYIQFINANKVFVDLYRSENGIRTRLTINGTHKIKLKEYDATS
jgi:hypothetical protein